MISMEEGTDGLLNVFNMCKRMMRSCQDHDLVSLLERIATELSWRLDVHETPLQKA